MNKSNIIADHTQAVIDRRKNFQLNAMPDGGFLSHDALEYDQRMQREISILGQIHNPRISAKSRAALNLN